MNSCYIYDCIISAVPPPLYSVLLLQLNFHNYCYLQIPIPKKGLLQSA